ncbi:MAG TPA: GGDEF domain-containing protein [Vicinamibacterales bacterium]|nr:GGDEF domain-containing protein [Vicinamibacterales bacterium]
MRLTTSADWPLRRGRRSSAAVLVFVVSSLLLVFLLDRATDAAPVQHLYYVPIIMAGAVFRMRGGVIAGLSAILLYHVANPHMLTFRYGESDLIQIVLFLAIGVATARFADDADRVRRLALTDDLTGLHNLRSFEARLLQLVRTSREDRTPLAVLVLDVDHLKALNDRYGHLAGAEAVRTVGHIIGQCLPPAAFGCRYGGDEFVVAAPRSTAFDGHRLAEELCEAVRSRVPILAGHSFRAGTLTISVGVVSASLENGLPASGTSRPDTEIGEAIFRAADAALYRAKAKGRDQVVVASDSRGTVLLS